jgi:hypothetical protein
MAKNWQMLRDNYADQYYPNDESFPTAEKFAQQRIDQNNYELNRVTIMLTNRCNFNCEFCVSKPEPKDMTDLDTETVKSIIKGVNERTIIRFTGGEPSLHKDFFELVQLALSKNGNTVEILSNGSFIPHDPKEFEKKIKIFLDPDYLSAGIKRLRPNIQIQISADPAHFKMDPHLKERILLLAGFIHRHEDRYRSIYAPQQFFLNTRGDFKNKVSAMLHDVSTDVSPKVIEHLGGLESAKHMAYKQFYSIFNLGKSIIRVGGAKKYVPSQELNGAVNIYEFNRLREIQAGIEASEFTINPRGNAFISVYSAYENMFLRKPESTSSTGQTEPPQRHTITYLGNVKQIGINGVLENYAFRRSLIERFFHQRLSQVFQDFYRTGNPTSSGAKKLYKDMKRRSKQIKRH